VIAKTNRPTGTDKENNGNSRQGTPRVEMEEEGETSGNAVGSQKRTTREPQREKLLKPKRKSVEVILQGTSSYL